MTGSPLSAGSMKSSRSMKTSERVARELVNHIVDNDLAEGTKLPNEKQLVEVFEVGRTTLREALRLLETRGVITVRPGPGGGPIVRRPRGDDLREGLTLILQFGGGSLKDVLDARTALEPMMARLAADRITDEQLDELSASAERMREGSADHDVFLAENQYFHAKIAEFTGSAVLRVFNDTLKSIADGVVVGVAYTARRRLAVAAAHEKVVDALRTRDPEVAAEAMHAHVCEAGEFWNRKYPELISRPVRWVH
ncbi:FadR/GntR family transcriptional regulator [Rhodococcus baikonurensis]|uniref:FadR/GntR family transcriptional regulator n=1 Tax=Rhodococcus baikonurensis TaxID=172041 RepID=UPI0037AB3246